MSELSALPKLSYAAPQQVQESSGTTMPRPRRERIKLELTPKHQRILTLYIAGLDEEEIGNQLGYTKYGVHSAIQRMIDDFFPEVAPLEGQARRRTLVASASLYLSDLEYTQRLIAQLSKRAFMQLFITAISNYYKGSSDIISSLNLNQLRHYIIGRIYGLRLNFHKAEPHLRSVSTIKKPRVLRGVILSDFANCQVMLGNFDYGRSIAQTSQDVYEHLLQHTYTSKLKDSLLLGIVRAILVQQQAWCYQGNIDKCHELSWQARTQIAMMKTPDHYALAKTYRCMGWCLLIRGLVDDRLSDVTLASQYMQISHKHACQINTPTYDFWWTFRDGLYLGSSWWKLISTSSAADAFVHLNQLDEASHYKNLWQLEFDSTPIRRWARDLPPLAPFYSWVIDKSDNLIPHHIIELYMHRRIQELKHLGLRSYLPFAHISYGDFIMNTTKSSEQARYQYEQAVTESSARNMIAVYKLASNRLSKL